MYLLASNVLHLKIIMSRDLFYVEIFGFYEFIQTLFGLSNSPAKLQRILGGFIYNVNLYVSLNYLNDILSSTYI